jgi:2-isopropylmalate synthase
MRKVVLGMDEDGIVELATAQARMFNELRRAAAGHEVDLPVFARDVLRHRAPFAKRVVDAVTEVWQPTPQRKCIVNLPSTVEHSTPNIFADMIEWMHRNLARRDSHRACRCIRTTTAAPAPPPASSPLMAGADRLEGCLFGNGERTGNLDLVNVALNLYSQGVHPRPRLLDIDEIRRTVEHCNQLPCTRATRTWATWSTPRSRARTRMRSRRPSAARKEGDIWDMPYLPLDPKDLGRSYEAVIRVNSQSGKGGISYLLEASTARNAAPPADRIQPGGAGVMDASRQGAHRGRPLGPVRARIRHRHIPPTRCSTA